MEEEKVIGGWCQDTTNKKEHAMDDIMLQDTHFKSMVI